jgi:uncharacterized protein YdhG (YjbR/CyaY superfamily)
MNPTFQTIDEYILSCPEEVRPNLQQVRETIRRAAPEAVEAISYAMPTFKLHGNLVHFAICKNHLGFYPAPSGLLAFPDEIAQYKSSKGAVQFPLDREIPFDLITRIVQFRRMENMEKAVLKKKTGSAKK